MTTATKRHRKTSTEVNAERQEALGRAVNGQSWLNYATIIDGFTAKGIAADDILPRVNVFTYRAWQAKGRQVRKGEHGVKVLTWVPMTKKDDDTGESKPIGRKPRNATVFHISQTDAMED